MARIPLSICLTGDKAALRLVLEPATGPVQRHSATGIVDVGEGGRLLSIEVEMARGTDPLFIDIDPPSGTLSRTAVASITVETGIAGTVSAITLPRRGHGYEITYPSGNQ
ncbi:MAG TPA: hypothetical protein VGR16_05775 [Thermomicrobiales bacterium]|nr:hypothetical protein [Thermomicrobiales bacterium]